MGKVQIKCHHDQKYITLVIVIALILIICKHYAMEMQSAFYSFNKPHANDADLKIICSIIVMLWQPFPCLNMIINIVAMLYLKSET